MDKGSVIKQIKCAKFIGVNKMLTIFKRQELIITYDLKRQSEIRDTLSQNGIKYYVKVINRKSPSPFTVGSRAKTGAFGEDLQLSYEYIIYVSKADYPKAKDIINR